MNPPRVQINWNAVFAILHQRSCGKEAFSLLFLRISIHLHQKMGMKTGFLCHGGRKTRADSRRKKLLRMLPKSVHSVTDSRAPKQQHGIIALGVYITVSCAICEKRKEKRFCLALHSKICPQCCGEQREVTLDCPAECIYLQQARAHEKPPSERDIPVSDLFMRVQVTEQFVYDNDPLLVGLSFALARRARSDRAINDRDLIAALTALAKSYETRLNSGLLYEAPTPSLGQRPIVDEMEKMLTEYRQLEQKQLGFPKLKDSEILQALVFLIRLAFGKTSGRPKSRAFVDFLNGQFPEKNAGILSPVESASSIIT
jgi:hypothetical protein